MPARVSVVLPVYNGERYLAEAIASVLGQTYADFEFIIVDDGSTDGSIEIIDEYARRDSRILPVLLPENQGNASARNRGIERARGEYVATFDHDDICLPNRLLRQVNYLDANPQVGVLGSNIWIVDQDLRLLSVQSYPQSHPLILWGFLFKVAIAGPTTLIRHDLLAAAGGYAEGNLSTDDTELWSRLIMKTRFANLPDILYLHRWHPRSFGNRVAELQKAEGAAIRQHLLIRLCGELSQETAELCSRVRLGEKNFSRAERKLLQSEMERLINAFVAAGWVAADERPLLTAAMRKTLQQTIPSGQHFWKRLL